MRSSPESFPDTLDQALAEGRLDDAEATAKQALFDADRHFEGIIGIARCALARGDAEQAMRWSGGAVRRNPNDMGVRSFHAAVALRAGRADVAVAALAGAETAIVSTPLVVLGWARARLGDSSGLLATFDTLLRRFPPSTTPAATDLGNHVLTTGIAPGWAAADTGCRVVGRLAPGVSLDAVFRVFVDGEEAVTTTAERLPRERADEDGFVLFSLKPPEGRPGAEILVTLDGVDLPGTPSRLFREPVAEGAVDVEDGLLRGWAWLPADPGRSVSVRVVDEDGRSVVVKTDRPLRDGATLGVEDGLHAFVVDPVQVGLKPGAIRVTAGPDDTPLAGSPTRRPPARRPTPVTAPPARVFPAAAPSTIVDILIPVHGGREETAACLSSLFESLDTPGTPEHEIIVIDDAGPDPRLARDLEAEASKGRITLLRNERNLGFPGTVNRGLALHPDRDAVLLNSDTLTAGDWLARLRATAHSHPAVASVTPLSNDATILSYPLSVERADPPPDAARTAALHAAAVRANSGRRIEIPTAVGFCVYLRRDALDEVGLFDAESFGRGYGEENDFCMRARRSGRRHLAATDVFVAHIGGRSFGRSKIQLIARNTRALERLHPGYQALITAFIHADPLMEARRRVDLVRWTDLRAKPSLLLVTLAPSGGVGRFVAERVRALSAEGRRVLTLSPSPFPDEEERRRKWTRRKTSERAGTGDDPNDDGPTGRCRLDVSDRPDLRDLVFRVPEEIELLASVLREAGVGAAEIHHLLGHVPEIATLPERLGIPHDLYLHDHGTICPRVDLVNDEGRYCAGRGVPDDGVCARCAADPRDRADPGLSATALRRRSRLLMSGARRVVAPSRDTVTRVSRRLFVDPPANLIVTPWEPDLTPPPPRVRRRDPGARRRVAVIGAVGRQKGYDILLACARDAALRDLPLEFVLIGYSDDDATLISSGRIFVTGRYLEEEAVDLVRSQNADIAFLPSISPETWCYALSTAWRADLHAVAFDLGAIAERVREKGGGYLLAPSSRAEVVNETILSFLDDYSEREIASERFPRENASGNSIAFVSSTPDQSRSTGEASPMTTSNSAAVPESSSIQATTQVLNLAPGFYSVSVVEGGAAFPVGHIPLPSIQLTSIPVPVAGSNVEFLGSLPGGWLTKTGDIVVIRVLGAQPSAVVLTSFKSTERPNDNLRLQLTRLGESVAAASVESAAVVPAPVLSPAPPKLDFLLHIAREGDRRFSSADWAGVIGQKAWIEAFAIERVDGVPSTDVEYKGLTANGWETSWLPAGELCGSRGMGVPLIGFAFRLKGETARRFECVYEGAFVSGRRTAPVRDGAPCRSDVIGDPLEGVSLRLVPRGVPAAPAPRVL